MKWVHSYLWDGTPDWRSCEGLAEDQRFVHSCTLEAHHFWISKDTSSGPDPLRVFRFDGDAGLDIFAAAGCSQDVYVTALPVNT